MWRSNDHGPDLLYQRAGRKLVICPPVLKDYWQETLREFGVPARVESMGKLDHILAGDYQRYDVVFVDEAHRFRNEGTQGYEKLHRICWGRKVVLVSATPLRNDLRILVTTDTLAEGVNHNQPALN